ncbi:hypothetical protein JYT15_00280 [Acidimicrobium ferrooxidans]|nr:hypothetical protein [Acidimicrobium ferrooxidans]
MSQRAEKVRLVVRLPVEMMERIDRHAQALGEKVAGVPFTRTDAVKALLTDALDLAENQAGKKNKKRKS